MEYVRVGNSGFKVSKIVLGCMTYGDTNWQPWVIPLEKALPIMKHAYDSGINTFDVADAYSNGHSEEIVGAFLKKYNIKRSSVVIMSKIYFRVDEKRGGVDPVGQQTNDGWQVNQAGLSRKHRLGTYADVLQIHRLDREAPMEEIMKGLNDVVESGKARYLGASSMAAWEFQMLQNIAEKHGWHKFISTQGFYNLIYREEGREMNPYCKATGVGLFPWSPLAAGVLTHSWQDRTDSREKSDVFLKALFRGREEAADKEIVSRVEEISKKKGCSMAQVAMGWVFAKGGMMPICGLMNEEQIDQAVEGIKAKLTEEEC
ncbi:Aldo/keto reductase [Acephala macrosclerotiorum]|nr:Aldo/keto reductase [Acephala macrosclerotiorum]